MKSKLVVRRATAVWALLLMMNVGSVGGAYANVPAVPDTPSLKAAKTAVVTVKKHIREAVARSLALVSKPANDAPDFDYQDRIAQAQAADRQTACPPG